MTIDFIEAVTVEAEELPVARKAPCANCQACTLRNEPFVPTVGPEKTQYAIIGIAPGQEEVRQGEGFVGPSGKLLNPALEDAGIQREDVIITNTVLCKTPANREPTDHEIACCAPRLKHEFKSAGVEYVLACGKTPRVVLLPETESISAGDIRGAWRWADNLDVWVLSTWHPAYVLRGNHDAYRDILEDCYKFANVTPETLPEVKYVVLETLEDLEKAVHEGLAAQVPIAVDTETSNRDNERSTPELFWEGYILCLGFHWEADKAFIVPKELFNSRAGLVTLKPLLENPHGIYGHNIKYDANYIMYYYSVVKDPINLKLVDDSFLMSYTLDERKGGHSLKAQATYWFNAPDYENEIHKYLKKPRVDSYSKVPVPVLHKYLAYDIQYSHALRVKLQAKLEQAGLYQFPYREILMRALPTISRMEFRGMRVDFDKLVDTHKMMSAKVLELDNKMQEQAAKFGVRVNLNSPAQMSDLIYHKIGLKFPGSRGRQKVKEGSTNKDILQKLKGQHAVVDILLEYRRWNKLLTTYVNGIPKVCDPQGYARYSFNLAGTESGRISGELALTMPRKNTPEGRLIRESFVVEDDEVLVSADFSQAELRWLGWFSGDDFLHEAYSDPNKDFHTEVAIAMYGEDFTKEERIWAKMLNFAFAYSYENSEWSFSQDTGVPVEKARAIVKAHTGSMSGAAQWKKDVWDIVKRRGYLQTPVGRMRRFPLITMENMHHARNEACNFLPQSISSDATLWGFSEAERHFHDLGKAVHPFLFLHDGGYLVCKGDPAIIKEVATVLRDKLLEAVYTIQDNSGIWVPEYAGLKRMPFKVDIEVGKSWGSLEDYQI